MLSPRPYSISFIAIISLISVQAQNTSDAAEPLIDQRWPWPYNGPPKIDTSNTARGIQVGDNLCNATTQNQQSICINGVVNSISDFCLFAPPAPNSTIADTEGEEVAWCTKSGYGTRIIPEGALQGVQAIRTPDYLEIVGFIDQTLINIFVGDSGGELDPHGADGRGNPIGSLMYSSAFSTNGSMEQVIQWNLFLGGGIFCIKVCDPASANAAALCLNTYDLIGCSYNMPANYGSINGTFESCAGDDQLPVGTYVSNGVTSTYLQPAESLGPITTIPYTAAIPASSNCTTYTSSSLYLAAESLASVSSASATPSSASSASHSSATSSSSGSSVAGVSSSSKPSSAAGSLQSVGLPAFIGVVAAMFIGFAVVLV
jgi:hypothetical protein